MMDGKITVNICYGFTFSIYDETAGLGPDKKDVYKRQKKARSNELKSQILWIWDFIFAPA